MRTLLLVLAFMISARAQFHQDRFAVGFWVGPQTVENLRDRYREIAEANFNWC